MAVVGNRNGAGNKGKIKSQAFKDHQRQVALNMPQEVRDKISATLTGQTSSRKGRTYEEIYGNERAAKIREIFSKQRRGVKNPNMARPWKGIGRGPTKIELKIQAVLRLAGIPFLAQHYIRPFTIDIYIPEGSIAVECDGDYWHSLPNVIEKDKRRDEFLSEQGIQVIHLTETQINQDPTVVLFHVGETQA
jgi:very-short-patch-repair endonuclease